MQSIVGIDVGASTCSLVNSDGEVLRNELGGHTTACLVAFGRQERFLGEAAVAQVSSNLKNTFSGLPLLLGEGRTSLEASKHWHYASFRQPLDDDASVSLEVEGQKHRPEALLAALLAKLQRLARSKLGDGPLKFALSVSPRVFQRPGAFRALMDAVGIAKLDVVRFPSLQDCLLACLNAKHPLAEDADPKTVVIVDIGATNTSVVAAEMQPAAAEPRLLAAKSSEVGCWDLDYKLFEHFRASVKEQHDVDVEAGSKRAFRLMRAVRKLRELLSTIPVAKVTVESLGDDLDVPIQADRQLFLEVCREELDDLRGLLNDAKEACGDAEVSLEICGGGTRAAAVHDVLKEVFGGQVAIGQKLDDASAAFGAAILGKDLVERQQTPEPPTKPPAAEPELPSSAEDAAGEEAPTDDVAEEEQGEEEAPMEVEDAENVPPQQTEVEVAAPEKTPLPDSETDAVTAAREQTGLSDERIAELADAELQMQKSDEEAQRRQEAMNAFESFVLEMRSASGRPHGDLISREVLNPFLDELEDWQYSEEAEAASTEDWLSKISECKTKVETELCKEWHEAIEQEKRDTEERLKASAERAAKERAENGEDEDDHDTRRLKFSDRYRIAERNKEEGTEVLKSGNVKLAAARYNKALSHCTKFADMQLSPEQEEQGNALKLSCTLNMSLCYLKMEDWAKVEYHTTNALQIDSSNVKALYRRACARRQLRKFDEAHADLSSIPEEAQDGKIKSEKTRVAREIKRQKEKQRKMAQRMFN